ncbi:phage tail tip fiber protein [Pseudomonas syringae]|uniref:phage tail tip fiber protein n=1 Tax=Pseudomonas syringae TaxID=317 RepID=UPI003204C13A
MQSNDYVPGVSGWKINTLTGDFEINLAKISVGGLPEQPQMITVTAGEWAAQDLPESAIEHYAFIGSEISKIPGEYRASAEIGTFDDSYEPGFVDIRTKLTYQRPETAEEIAARTKASRSTGYSIKKEGDKFTFFNNGVPHIVLGDINKVADKPDKPFVVEAGQVFINEALIADGMITNKMAPRPGFSDSVVPNISIKMRVTQQGHYFAAGIGQHLEGMAADIKHEATTRASADTQLSARIGALEGRISAAGFSITQQGAAITPLK